MKDFKFIILVNGIAHVDCCYHDGATTIAKFFEKELRKYDFSKMLQTKNGDIKWVISSTNGGHYVGYGEPSLANFRKAIKDVTIFINQEYNYENFQKNNVMPTLCVALNDPLAKMLLRYDIVFLLKAK